MQVIAKDAVVLFLDLQEGTILGEKTVGRHRLRKTAGALAKLCALHGLPAFLSSIAPAGPFIKNVLGPLDHPPLRPRTYTTAFADASLIGDVTATDRNTLVLAGVASEIVVLRTALDALAAGFAVQIAVDACGGFSERTEAAAWSRATAAGATLTSVITIAAELAGDFTSDTGMETMKILYEAAGK